MTTLKSYPLLDAATLQFVRKRTSPHSFAFNILKMNEMYKLPVGTEPSLDKLTKPNGEPETAVNRMKGFLKTLRDECAEGQEILAKLQLLASSDPLTTFPTLMALPEDEAWDEKVYDKLQDFAALCVNDHEEATKDVLTDIADWLGDIPVYCRSEAMKYGLPLEEVLEVIMGSNFTKLPSDGVPVHDANGKFLKDMTNFVPPEPAIKTILFGLKSADDAEPASLVGLVNSQKGSTLKMPDANTDLSPAHAPRHPYSNIDRDQVLGTGAESDVI